VIYGAGALKSETDAAQLFLHKPGLKTHCDIDACGGAVGAYCGMAKFEGQNI